jgi:hypothetical protein
MKPLVCTMPGGCVTKRVRAAARSLAEKQGEAWVAKFRKVRV